MNPVLDFNTVSFIVPFSEEPNEELLRLAQELQQKANEINGEIREIDPQLLSEEDLNHLYSLDLLSSPPNVRGYLLTNTDDSSRLLGATADYLGAIPEESNLKQSLSSMLDGLTEFLEGILSKYFPPPPPDGDE